MTPIDADPHGDPDDGERDKHLLAALRHAPDRDLAPPPALSATILARARAAVRPAARTDVPPWWQALVSWAVGPQGAAAFGTLAVATLVGVIWSTQAPREPAVPQQASQPPAIAPTDQREAPVAATAPPVERDVAARATARDSDAAAETAKASPPPARARQSEPARAEVAPKQAAAAANAQAPAPAAPAAMGQAAPAAPSAQPLPAAQERRSAESRADESPGAADRTAAAPARQRADSRAAHGQLRAAGVDPLWRADQRLSSAPGTAAWHAGATTWPHGQAQQRWWAQLREATRGRWQRVDSGAALTAPWLVLSMGPDEEALFAIDGNTLELQMDTARWTATLPEPTLRELRDAISRW